MGHLTAEAGGGHVVYHTKGSVLSPAEIEKLGSLLRMSPV